MDIRDKDLQTPDRFGEMYVTWRLDEGLFSEEIGSVRYRIGIDEEKELSVNELAREIATIMMPFLSTHPDVGFESFRKTMRIMAKSEIVYCHHSPLAGEHPHVRISEAVDAACEAFGSQYPKEMMIYAKLGSNQNLYINQYKNLKVHMFMYHWVKHVDIHIVTGHQSAGTLITQGEIYVWLAQKSNLQVTYNPKARLFITVTVKNIDMKFKEIKNMTLTQIWEKIQKPFNFAWKAGIIVIAVGMACGLFSELMSFICCSMADRISDIEYLSENVEARYYTDGTCRLYKRSSDRKLSKKLKFVDSCPMTDDSLTSYQSLEGKWGFIDMNSGNIVIPASYEKVWDFNEGLAAVADAEQKVGFIDKTGELQIPMMDVDYRSGYYSFENGIAILEASETGLKGAINKEGTWVLPMAFFNIFYPDDEGYMKVYDGEHWGLYDSVGNEVFPIIYDDIYYDKGLKGVFTQKDGIKQLVTTSGEVIEPFVVDRIQPLRYIVNYLPESDNEYATHPYLVDYNIDIYHGVLDTRNGKVVIPAIYDTIEMISKDMIKASLGLENIESVVFDPVGKQYQ